jgi:hypothetical protein
LCVYIAAFCFILRNRFDARESKTLGRISFFFDFFQTGFYLSFEKSHLKPTMTSSLAVKLDLERAEKCSVIHLMPCKISFDGSADVKSFFDSSIMEATDGDSKTSKGTLRSFGNNFCLDVFFQNMKKMLNDKSG